MNSKELNPTLWRTARALMNEVRLRLLWVVVVHPDEMNVTRIARLLDIPQPVATNGLRALQARGVIGVRRERYSVYYNIEEDRSLPDASRLRNAFLEFFESRELSPEWTDEMMVLLKAFTHFNRLAMLRRLAEGEATKSDLEKASGIVVKTLEHHLHILIRAGLIERTTPKNAHTAFYRLVLPQTHPVARELLRQTLDGKLDYLNAGTGREKNLRLIHDQDGNRGFIVNRPVYFEG